MPLIDYSSFLDKLLPKPKYKKSYRHAKQSYLNRIRLAVTFFYFGMGFCFASWASRIPDIKAALHLNEADLGTLLFAVPIGQLVAIPFSGRIVSRFGSHKVLGISLFLYSCCLVSLGLASVSWQLALGLFLFGIAGNFCNIAVNTQGVYTEGLFRKPIMGSFHGAWSLAGFCGAITGLGMMALKLNPPMHFVIVGLFITLLSLPNYKFLIRAKPKHETKKAGFFAGFESTLIWLGIISFCCKASEGVMYDWSGVYFREIVKAPGALVMLGYSAFMITMSGGRFIGDKLVQKYGRRSVLQASGLLISAGLFLAVFCPYIIPSTIAFMMVGLGVSTVIPMVYSIAGKSTSVPASLALTVVTSVSFLGFLTGPPVIGYIAEQSSLRYSFAFIGIFGVGITILVNRIKAIA
jgi:MFS family permease